jgi:hypothetical protein
MSAAAVAGGVAGVITDDVPAVRAVIAADLPGTGR